MSWLKLLVGFVVTLAPWVAHAESEKCDPFTFAVKNGPPPMTLLRAGVSPILSISGQLYHFDPVAQCFRNTSAPQPSDCSKSQKVLVDGKAVAVIEGKSKVMIFATDAHGNANRNNLYYQMMVEHDRYRYTQPRFWLEAVNPRDQKTGRPQTVGRLDSVEGLTIAQLAASKAPLASGRKLVNLNGASLMYSNCRKLTVTRFDERFYPVSTGRAPASGSEPWHLQQPPRPVRIARASSKR